MTQAHFQHCASLDAQYYFTDHFQIKSYYEPLKCLIMFLCCRISGWPIRSWRISWRRDRMRPHCNPDTYNPCVKKFMTCTMSSVCTYFICLFQRFYEWRDDRKGRIAQPASVLRRGNEAAGVFGHSVRLRSQTCTTSSSRLSLIAKQRNVNTSCTNKHDH